MKLVKQFWGWCVFLITMAVVGVVCYIGFSFTKGKVDEEMDRKKLVEVKAQVHRRVTKKDKQDKSLPAKWTEVVLPNGRKHAVEGDLGVPGEWITVKVPKYLTLDDDGTKSDVEKEEAEEKAREERKKKR